MFFNISTIASSGLVVLLASPAALAQDPLSGGGLVRDEIEAMVSMGADTPVNLFDPQRVLSPLLDGRPLPTPEPLPAELQPPVFSEAEAVPGMKGAEPFISADGLELYMRFGTTLRREGAGDIWRAVRPSREAPFAAPEPLEEINTEEFYECAPVLSPDGLTLYFTTNRFLGWNWLGDIACATRPSRTEPFGPVERVHSLGTCWFSDILVGVTADNCRGLILRGNGWDPQQMFHIRRASPDLPWETPELVAELAEPETVTQRGWLSADGSTLLYPQAFDERSCELTWTILNETTYQFYAPVTLEEPNSPFQERNPSMTADGSELYFASNRAEGYRIYRAMRIMPAPVPTATPSPVPTRTPSPSPEPSPTPSALTSSEWPLFVLAGYWQETLPADGKQILGGDVVGVVDGRLLMAFIRERQAARLLPSD